jgi:hypothetical protein
LSYLRVFNTGCLREGKCEGSTHTQVAMSCDRLIAITSGFIHVWDGDRNRTPIDGNRLGII